MNTIDLETDPQKQRTIIQTVVDHIMVDWIESEKKHVVEIIYKNPINNKMLMDDGTDLKSGANILQQRLERLEPSVIHNRDTEKALSFTERKKLLLSIINKID